MAVGAKIDSTDAIKQLRVALIKFAELGNVALSSADSDIDRVIGWLERDQASYWNNQYRKRAEAVTKAEDAVRQKRIFKGVDGTTQSVVDEMKALQIAKRKKEEAEQKLLAIKKNLQMLKKEAQLYKGRTQRLATAMQSDVPQAVHRLDNYMMHVESYLAVQTAGGGIAPGQTEDFMAQFAPSKRVGHDKLRDQTPSPERRKAAKQWSPNSPFDKPFDEWGTGPAHDWQRAALAKLNIEKLPIDPDQKIVCYPDGWKQAKVYLERLEPAFDGDTGWYIGPYEPPADNATVELISVRVGDIVGSRPDLVDLLSLPTGFLVVMDTGGLAAAVDPAGLDAWAIALIAADQPADEPADAPASDATPAEAQPVTGA